jgi:hypothetical protein
MIETEGPERNRPGRRIWRQVPPADRVWSLYRARPGTRAWIDSESRIRQGILKRSEPSRTGRRHPGPGPRRGRERGCSNSVRPERNNPSRRCRSPRQRSLVEPRRNTPPASGPKQGSSASNRHVGLKETLDVPTISKTSGEGKGSYRCPSVSGSNCEGHVGAALRVPSYAASPLGQQASHGKQQMPPSFRDICRALLAVPNRLPCATFEDGSSLCHYVVVKRDSPRLLTTDN